jgi:DNA polymerase III subunit epsilon
MREIVLDTETTGLDPLKGERLVEIGCVELLNHLPTGNTFHVYLNPQRTVSEGALRVHGLTDAFLQDKPLFGSVVDDFLAFIGNDRLVIHNAPFDMGFINAELSRAGKKALSNERVLDTLILARQKHKGQSNTLDALCARYGVDTPDRTKHGALLDAQILADVYLEMLGGRQQGLTLAVEKTTMSVVSETIVAYNKERPIWRSRVTAHEKTAHREFVEGLSKAPPLWKKTAVFETE